MAEGEDGHGGKGSLLPPRLALGLLFGVLLRGWSRVSGVCCGPWPARRCSHRCRRSVSRLERRGDGDGCSDHGTSPHGHGRGRSTERALQTRRSQRHRHEGACLRGAAEDGTEAEHLHSRQISLHASWMSGRLKHAIDLAEASAEQSPGREPVHLPHTQWAMVLTASPRRRSRSFRCATRLVGTLRARISSRASHNPAAPSDPCAPAVARAPPRMRLDARLSCPLRSN